MSDEFITIAKVAKTQGRRGEVAVELFTDFPERFEERRKLWALDPKDARRELQLEEFWPHKGQMVLKFAGIDSIDQAEMLVGSEIQIPVEQRAALEEGAVYVSELLGCTVSVIEPDGVRNIGTVADVDFSAGEAPLLVVRGSGSPKAGTKGPFIEFLIPFADTFLRKLDTQARRIEMELPEGMLELDAPVSTAERQQQKQEAEEGGSGKKRRR